MRIASPAATLVNIDWLYMVRQGKAFFRYGELAASVGNFSEIQLLNPVGSTITLIPYAAIVASTTAQVILINTFDTALATLLGAGVNLNLGGAAGQGVVRTAQPAASNGTVVAEILVPANQSLSLPITWLDVQAAGKGIVILGNNANTTLYVTYWWVEI